MPAYFRTHGVPRPSATYRANTVSPKRGRGKARRMAARLAGSAA